MLNQQELLNEIKVLSDSIRKKNLALKAGLDARNRYLEDTFKPIIDPLNKIKETVKRSSLSDREVDLGEKGYRDEKYEPSSETQHSDHDTDSVSITSDIIEEEDNYAEQIKSEKEEKDKYSDTQSISESPTNITILSQEIGNKGPLSRKYILRMLHSARQRPKYHVYGARLEEDGIRIGDCKLKVDDSDKIEIKGQVFKGTDGLFQLIFQTIPQKYTKTDLKNYKSICMLTNSHKKGYSPHTPIHRNRSEKYKNIIARLFNEYRGKRRKSMGKGMSMKSVYNTNVIYYNNVNKLVDRMRLIHESIQAGHTGLDNEMVALTEELKSRGYIT